MTNEGAMCDSQCRRDPSRKKVSDRVRKETGCLVLLRSSRDAEMSSEEPGQYELWYRKTEASGEPRRV